jgi:hypothetical protein
VTPVLTVFTASARLDLARLWLACVVRAFPRDEVVVEIFDDSKDGVLTPGLLPRATVVRPGPGRRDFQEAYNDALRRASTPFLVLLDTDAYATSADVWPFVRERLADENVAAVSCAPRTATKGYDTVAIVLKVAAYRAALAAVPDGFFPRAERLESGDPPGRWFGHDTGDLLTSAVVALGGKHEVLRLEEAGSFVRFDALTNAHLLASWAGRKPLLSLVRRHAYFRDGCLGNLALRAVYEKTFHDGPPFSFGLSARALWIALASGGLTSLRDGVGRARRMRAGGPAHRTFPPGLTGVLAVLACLLAAYVLMRRKSGLHADLLAGTFVAASAAMALSGRTFVTDALQAPHDARYPGPHVTVWEKTSRSAPRPAPAP